MGDSVRMHMCCARQGLKCETSNAFHIKSDRLGMIALSIGRIAFAFGAATFSCVGNVLCIVCKTIGIVEATWPPLDPTGRWPQDRQHNTKMTSTVVLEPKRLERSQTNRMRRHKLHQRYLDTRIFLILLRLQHYLQCHHPTGTCVQTSHHRTKRTLSQNLLRNDYLTKHTHTHI
jgi:hypothetical protein